MVKKYINISLAYHLLKSTRNIFLKYIIKVNEDALDIYYNFDNKFNFAKSKLFSYWSFLVKFV